MPRWLRRLLHGSTLIDRQADAIYRRAITDLTFYCRARLTNDEVAILEEAGRKLPFPSHPASSHDAR